VLVVVVSFIVLFLYCAVMFLYCVCALCVCNVCYLSVVLLYYCHRAEAQVQFNKYIYIYKYELGFYTPEDDILHSHRLENLKSYQFVRSLKDDVLLIMDLLPFCWAFTTS
jgi:hypothetical protein